MTRERAGGDGGTTPGADAVVEPDDMAVLPSFPVVMCDDHIGGLDKGKLKILI